VLSAARGREKRQTEHEGQKKRPIGLLEGGRGRRGTEGIRGGIGSWALELWEARDVG
jgi:hypothetical protein